MIEKDCIAGKLASDLKADQLIILTGVERVYKNFHKENQEGIRNMTVADAKRYIEEGHFGKGDMLPDRFHQENGRGSQGENRYFDYRLIFKRIRVSSFIKAESSSEAFSLLYVVS